MGKHVKTKESKDRRIVFAVVLILLIMGMSFAFRFVVKRQVDSRLGDAYMDPETGVPYLTEMDSYYHLRMTRDIETLGHPGEAIQSGEYWDTLSYAPYGRSAQAYRPLLAYMASGAHKLLSLFAGITLEQVVYWLGAVISTLVVIPVFIFVCRLKGPLAAATASVLAAINYGYFIHTVPGFYDTDSVILWTSCCVFCFGSLFVGTLTPEGTGGQMPAARVFGRRAGYAGLFAGSLLFLILSWEVYYLFAGIFILALLLYAVLKVHSAGKTERRKSIRNLAPVLGAAAALIVFILITRPGLFGSMIGTLRDVFTSGKGDLFPNAYVSVSEMRKPSLVAGGLTGLFQMKVLSESNIGIINAVGSLIPCCSAVAMCVILIIRLLHGDIRFEYVLLVLWFLITAVLAFRSWRFIMLFAIPVAILAGMLTGTMHALMRDHKMMDYQIFSGMIAILMMFPAVYGAYRSSGDSLPQVNRPLHESLDYIREQMPETTIVAGWWDYGYFFEEKTGRRALFDGGSQSGQRIYWVAKALAATDEQLSGNIIRMLAGAGDEGTDRMLSVFGENRDTLKQMEQLLSGEKEAAHAALLTDNISRAEADELTERLFPDTSDPVVFVVTQGMQQIAGWFVRFGYSGDDRYAANRYSVLFDRLEYREENNQGGWRIIRNGNAIDLVVQNTGGVYRAYTMLNGQWNASQPFPVERVLVRKDGKIAEFRVQNVVRDGELGYTVILNLDTAVPTGSLMTSLMADSVFGRLYYLGGAGMTYYHPVEDAAGSAALFRVEKDQ